MVIEIKSRKQIINDYLVQSSPLTGEQKELLTKLSKDINIGE